MTLKDNNTKTCLPFSDDNNIWYLYREMPL